MPERKGLAALGLLMVARGFVPQVGTWFETWFEVVGEVSVPQEGRQNCQAWEF